MEKAYEPKKYEDDIYQKWEESGFFNPDNLPGDRTEPFSVMMPPPNVTGVLHLGHALENALMDIEIRYQRMKGKKAVLLPGTDHAAVATQARVEDNLKKEGIDNPRQHYGREKLIELIREYAEDSKSTILNQIRKMGTSCDWSRLAYTFDEPRSRTVNEIFKRMYKDGLIYRGHRVVNWSVVGQSTCSEEELIYVDQPTKIYTFKYAADFPIPIASTRPETKLGDTAVAVHPDDKRYKEFIGKTYTADIGAAKPLTIKIIADEAVDPEYGTGAVGVTPAHSKIDYEMYERNKEIGLIQVIGIDGKMTAAAGSEYEGLTTQEAREKLVKWLQDNNLLESEEDTEHNVGTSDRFKDVVEALPLDQWFVNVDKEIPGRGKSLKELMKEAVTTGHNGDPEQKVTILPDRFNKTYLHWIDNLRDWCISRQIWWGHRIPIWYKGDEARFSEDSPGDGWVQDEDTLDTWFSSGTWTFSTLGWPEETDDLHAFHPTSWMQMGYEIIFLWLARMVLMSTYALDEIPFRDVYVHGILRDKDGNKFSKSAGNGIDPLEVIEQYGTDALRLSLIKSIAPGNDARFFTEKVEDARNFVNKLWNISRFVLSQEEGAAGSSAAGETTGELSIADKWIQSRLANLVAEVTKDLDEYQFSQASEKIYDFVWHEFADWYIEISKIEELNCTQQRAGLHTILKLLHPMTPYVTEALAQQTGLVKDGEYLMVADWPTADESAIDEKLDKRFTLLQELITNIRSIRKSYNISAKETLEILASGFTDEEQLIIEHLSCTKLVEEKTYTSSATAVAGKQKVIIPLDGVIDVAKEKKRIQKEINQLEKHLKGLEAKLSNEKFLASAPPEVVEQTKASQEERETELDNLQQSLKSLEG
ncbi:valine--tRNA ligase [Patescibacteria group bacterium]